MKKQNRLPQWMIDANGDTLDSKILKEKKHRAITSALDQKIEEDDKKFSSIVNMLIKEMEKRKIDFEDSSFDSKIDEVIETLCKSKHYRLIFGNTDRRLIIDIRNALKRKLNISQKITERI